MIPGMFRWMAFQIGRAVMAWQLVREQLVREPGPPMPRQIVNVEVLHPYPETEWVRLPFPDEIISDKDTS
jgi:hypothetical protein